MGRNKQSVQNPSTPYWSWTLYGSILLYFILPAVYENYRLFLIGNTIPNDSALSIVSQWQFIQVGFEIIQEAIVLPIFFFVGSQLQFQKTGLFDRLRAVIFLLGCIVVPLFILIQSFLPQFVVSINVEPSIVKETIDFLSVRIWGITLGIFASCFIAVLQSLNLSKSILILTLLKVFSTFGLDTYFFGGHSFSLGLGVMGIAWSQLIIDSFMLIASILSVLTFGKISLLTFLRGHWRNDLSQLLKLSFWSGLESFIRNIAYLTMVLSFLNLISKDAIAGYYLVMQLFWTLGLIPVLAAAETTKALIANHHRSQVGIISIFKPAFLIATISIVLWIILTPFLMNILRFFNPNENVISFAKSSYFYLLLPYCLLAFNFILDAFLYGTGKIKYMAFQAIITHLLTYLPAFILFKWGVWQPVFEDVMLLIGAAIVLDSILTILYAKRTFLKIDIR